MGKLLQVAAITAHGEFRSHLFLENRMFFYAGICSKCNCGLGGDRYPDPHSDNECQAFLKLRAEVGMPLWLRADQDDMRKVLALKKKEGKVPDSVKQRMQQYLKEHPEQ